MYADQLSDIPAKKRVNAKLREFAARFSEPLPYSEFNEDSMMAFGEIKKQLFEYNTYVDQFVRDNAQVPTENVLPKIIILGNSILGLLSRIQFYDLNPSEVAQLNAYFRNMDEVLLRQLAVKLTAPNISANTRHDLGVVKSQIDEILALYKSLVRGAKGLSGAGYLSRKRGSGFQGVQPYAIPARFF